jgi:hypothetical protein
MHTQHGHAFDSHAPLLAAGQRMLFALNEALQRPRARCRRRHQERRQRRSLQLRPQCSRRCAGGSVSHKASGGSRPAAGATDGQHHRVQPILFIPVGLLTGTGWMRVYRQRRGCAGIP